MNASVLFRAAVALPLGSMPWAMGDEKVAKPPLWIELSSFKDFRSAFEDSPMGRLIADPACEHLRIGFTQQILEVFDQAVGTSMEDGSEKNDIKELWSYLDGTSAIGFLSINDPAVTLDSADDICIALGMYSELGSNREEFERTLERVIDEMVKEGSFRRSSETVGEHSVEILTEIESEDEAGDHPFEARFTYRENAVLVSFADHRLQGRDFVSETLELWEARSIREVKDDAEAEPSARALLRLSADLEQLWSLAQAEIQQDEAMVEELPDMLSLGLGSFESLLIEADLGASGSTIQSALRWKEAGVLQSFLLALGAGKDLSLLELVPDSVFNVVALSFDPTALVDSFLSAGKIFDADAAALATTESQLRPVTNCLGGQLCFFMSPVPEEEALPLGTDFTPEEVGINVCLMASLKDPKALLALVEPVLRSSGLHAARRREEFEGYELFHVPFFAVMLHYAIVGESLILSLSDTLIKDVLRRKSGAELPTLLQSDLSKRAMESLRPGFSWYQSVTMELMARSILNGMAQSNYNQAVEDVLRDATAESEEELDEIVSKAIDPADFMLPSFELVERFVRGRMVTTVHFSEGELTTQSVTVYR